MHESESSSSHSVLESKSSHESNLAHESDSSPSPGLEYYNTDNMALMLWSDITNMQLI